ncbi:MAG: DUF1573 domain-containing protein [Bacteroidota bacterium]
MKKLMIAILLPAAFIFSQVNAQNQTAPAAGKTEVKAKVNGPVARWDVTENNMGDIPQGIPRSAQFNLTNDGNEPLIIASAQASCGCTNLSYLKDPLMPGKSMAISATYNAAAKGPFTKTITVRTNASDQPTILWIKGTVVEKAEEKK